MLALLLMAVLREAGIFQYPKRTGRTSYSFYYSGTNGLVISGFCRSKLLLACWRMMWKF